MVVENCGIIIIIIKDEKIAGKTAWVSFLPNDYSPIASNFLELHLQALELKKSEIYYPIINIKHTLH